jgi:hypothetical protein
VVLVVVFLLYVVVVSLPSLCVPVGHFEDSPCTRRYPLLPVCWFKCEIRTYFGTEGVQLTCNGSDPSAQLCTCSYLYYKHYWIADAPVNPKVCATAYKGLSSNLVADFFCHCVLSVRFWVIHFVWRFVLSFEWTIAHRFVLSKSIRFWPIKIWQLSKKKLNLYC